MSQENNPNNHEEFPPDDRPFLCIPYWTKPLTAGGTWDTGQDRALPSSVVSYACESIHTSPYRPGQPLDVSVVVRNSGGGNSAAIATVTVYWTVPSVSFSKPKFFAATVVDVKPSRKEDLSKSTPMMTATIPLNEIPPAADPNHVCLVVSVSHSRDRAGTMCDPVNDRHWACHNLQAVPAAVGAPAIVPFTAANPFNLEKSFELEVGPVDERHARLVAREFQTEPSDIQPRLRVLDAQGAAVAEEGERIRTSVHLGPFEERQFQIIIEIDGDLAMGRSAGVEAKLFERSDKRGHVGSLGVVLLRPDPK